MRLLEICFFSILRLDEANERRSKNSGFPIQVISGKTFPDFIFLNVLVLSVGPELDFPPGLIRSSGNACKPSRAWKARKQPEEKK